MSLYDHRKSRHNENDAAGACRDPLIEQALGIAETARQCIVRHDPGPDFIADKHERRLVRKHGRFEPLDFGVDVAVGQHDVREPQRQAVDQDSRGPGKGGQRAGKIQRRVDGPPVMAAAVLMFGDACRHLVVEGFRFDQLMSLAWKVMLPLGLVNLVAVATIVEYQKSLEQKLGGPWGVTFAMWGLSLVAWIAAGLFAPLHSDNAARKDSFVLDAERRNRGLRPTV